jgi:hypothetical protein
MSAFVSNGSGSGVYDPVTTTEGFPNGSEVRINDYDDPWYSGFKGGRTYSYGTYRKSGVKSLCEGLRNRTKPRCLLITVIGVVLLMLLVLIIIVAQSHHTSYTADPNQRNTWSKTSIGMNIHVLWLMWHYPGMNPLIAQFMNRWRSKDHDTLILIGLFQLGSLVSWSKIRSKASWIWPQIVSKELLSIMY